MLKETAMHSCASGGLQNTRAAHVVRAGLHASDCCTVSAMCFFAHDEVVLNDSDNRHRGMVHRAYFLEQGACVL